MTADGVLATVEGSVGGFPAVVDTFLGSAVVVWVLTAAVCGGLAD